jgi:Tfp pilus assembly pilus retraction ATPase PilT
MQVNDSLLTKALDKDMLEINSQLCQLEGKPALRAFQRGFSAFHWNGYRVRVSRYSTLNQRAINLRFLPDVIRPLANLGFEDEVQWLLTRDTPGLVLISGGPCAGKTTTLAAIVNHFNQERQMHIRTLENPVEYTYQNKNSLITQQWVEPGADIDTYQEAVEEALLQDVNIMVFGEIKGLESLKAAIKAANLNMLVFATIHAPTVPWTIMRVIDEFPEADRHEATRSLARCIKAVVCQKLTAQQYPDQSCLLKMAYQAADFSKRSLKERLLSETIHELGERFDSKLFAIQNQTENSDEYLYIHPDFGKTADV